MDSLFLAFVLLEIICPGVKVKGPGTDLVSVIRERYFFLLVFAKVSLQTFDYTRNDKTENPNSPLYL